VVTTIQDLTTLRFRNPAKNAVAFVAKQQVYAWLNQQVAHKSVALITPTQFVKDDTVSFCDVDPDKITVTLESADDLPTPAKPVDSVAKNAEFIMYVGRPTPHKNLERLVQAFKLLQETHPQLCLVLVGKKDANYDRIESSVKQQGITNVIFTGFVDDQQLRWLYEHCRAYVFPSLSEGFGLPGLEAMRHNAPVASSNATCLPEVHGDAALYFDPLNIEDIAKTISKILDDEALRNKLIEKGKKQVTKFSWARMAKQTLQVFEKALKL
jgi:glycosyltransferase involved in cell wall biosynthesis